MRILLSALTLGTAIAAIAATVPPSAAQGPYHPYCALDSSSGATSCYYDTRCSHCISNPAYAGPEGTAARARGYRAPRR
ncbi:MAG: hypothetical protein QOK01_32 [Alphaproteobacteria bacterium]|nr:hypothetical protein [Alphaproteobacteria bacterium]